MILLSILLQVTPVAPLPKGTGLPPPASEEGQVMAPITALLRAQETNDRDAVRANTLPEGGVTAVRTGRDGRPERRTLRWAEFAARLTPRNGSIVERLGTPAVEIDGNVAMVWAPYTVTVDGKLSHCGYNLFDVVREASGWRVLNVTYSSRTEGCAA